MGKASSGFVSWLSAAATRQGHASHIGPPSAKSRGRAPQAGRQRILVVHDTCLMTGGLPDYYAARAFETGTSTCRKRPSQGAQPKTGVCECTGQGHPGKDTGIKAAVWDTRCCTGTRPGSIYSRRTGSTDLAAQVLKVWVHGQGHAELLGEEGLGRGLQHTKQQPATWSAGTLLQPDPGRALADCLREQPAVERTCGRMSLLLSMTRLAQVDTHRRASTLSQVPEQAGQERTGFGIPEVASLGVG
jgi:hypothetical protein